MEQQNEDSHDNTSLITVVILSSQTRKLLSTLLNPKKFLKTDNGKPRDWQGLAELCGISGEKIPYLQNVQDPTNEILKLWLEKDKNEATIGKLLEYLEELDRYDIVDDLEPLIEHDKDEHRKHPNGLKLTLESNSDNDGILLTHDDVIGQSPQLYDAFVLFDEKDIDFATELIEKMERQYNLKFCVKDRDLVAGIFENTAVITLLAERCNRLIVIITPSFLESPVHKFFYKFAQTVGIEHRQRKIIPCIYKECGKLPVELNYYFKLDYTKSGKFYDFYDKLYDSIKTSNSKPKEPANNLVSRSLSQYNPPTSKTIPNSSLKPALHSEDRIRPPQLGVKFSSMCNLTEAGADKIIPEEGIKPSESEYALSISTMKKNRSFYKKISSLIKSKPSESKSKLAEPEKPKENEKFMDEAIDMDKDKKSKKEKKNKKFWTRNKEKKKQMVALMAT